MCLSLEHRLIGMTMLKTCHCSHVCISKEAVVEEQLNHGILLKASVGILQNQNIEGE